MENKAFLGTGQLDLRIWGHTTFLLMFGVVGLSKSPYNIKILSNDITY